MSKCVTGKGWCYRIEEPEDVISFVRVPLAHDLHDAILLAVVDPYQHCYCYCYCHCRCCLNSAGAVLAVDRYQHHHYSHFHCCSWVKGVVVVGACAVAGAVAVALEDLVGLV